MAKIEIKMPEGWKSQISDNYVEAEKIDGTAQFEITVGDMPEDSAAPEQALINFIDILPFLIIIFILSIIPLERR